MDDAMAADFQHPFYFLRHGETHWNLERRTQGQTDSMLNDTGLRQADEAAALLASEPLERIIASPLSRARITAEKVARRHAITVETRDGLMECHLGRHQGEPHGHWLVEYFSGEYDPPDGEAFPEFCERVWQAMALAVAEGPNTLIVAHGGLWIAAQQFVRIQPSLPRLQNAVPVHVTPAKDGWHQRLVAEGENHA